MTTQLDSTATYLPLAAIRRSPTNPRKRFNDADCHHRLKTAMTKSAPIAARAKDSK